MYDQVSRAILGCLDEIGFNISDYRDKEGNYSISAEKIDSIAIGEKIHLNKSESKSENKDKVESGE